MRVKSTVSQRGSHIGLRLSMADSRIVMGMWDKQLAQLGEESGWIIHLLKRYVDDVTATVETLKMGVRWTKSQRVANVSDVFVSDECESPSNGADAAAAANAPPSTSGLVYKKA